MNNEPIYLDTNVIMDFILNRDNSAFKLIAQAISCKFYILISDLVIKEINYQDLKNEINSFYKILKACNKICIDKTLDSDKILANEIIKTYNTHYSDALHKVIAKRNNARYLVTKNIKDFICFNDIIIVKPDEILN